MSDRTPRWVGTGAAARPTWERRRSSGGAGGYVRPDSGRLGASAPAVTATPPASPASATPGARPAQAKGAGTRAGRGPQRARLQVRQIGIWSAFKISLILSIALVFSWLITVGVVYGVLSSLGVVHTVYNLFGQPGSASGSGAISENNVVTPGVVLAAAAVIGAITVILMTAMWASWEPSSTTCALTWSAA